MPTTSPAPTRRAPRRTGPPRLRPGAPLLWCDATTVQVGTDPRWAVRLTDLSPAATTVLAGTAPGSELATVTAHLRAEGVTSEEVDAIVEHLRAAHLVVDAPRGSGVPGEATWALMREDGDGGAQLGGRRRRTVRVTDLGRTGLGVALGLAASGVGVLELDDDRAVRPGDAGPGSYPQPAVGRARAAAAADLLTAATDDPPQLRTSRLRPEPDLVILVERGSADPLRSRRLMADGCPHLSIVHREASVLVGPLVVPGSGPCLRCLDLYRARADDHWPAIAAQLALRDAADDDPTLAGLAAALAVPQALAHLDGRPTTLSAATVEVALPDATPRYATRPVHPDCGCTGL